MKTKSIPKNPMRFSADRHPWAVLRLLARVMPRQCVLPSRA